MRAFFISDLHLKDPGERSSQTLLRFLLAIEKTLSGPEDARTTHLFLVGDIFDLWIGNHKFFIDRFSGIVKQLRWLHGLGVYIHYFEGNHDLYLQDFWQDEAGIQVHTEPRTFTIDGRIVRVEHGDLINPDDMGYLFLHGLLRSRPMTWLAKNLPEQAVQKIGEYASLTSREYTSTAKGLPEDEIRKLIRAHAVRELAREPFDFMITGHVHVRDEQKISIGGRSALSINLGWWMNGASCFTISPSRTGFVELPAEGEIVL